jgi:hypothetical protein
MFGCEPPLQFIHGNGDEIPQWVDALIEEGAGPASRSQPLEHSLVSKMTLRPDLYRLQPGESDNQRLRIEHLAETKRAVREAHEIPDRV